MRALARTRIPIPRSEFSRRGFECCQVEHQGPAVSFDFNVCVCVEISNKKLVETSATLLVTGALLVVTIFATRNKCIATSNKKP